MKFQPNPSRRGGARRGAPLAWLALCLCSATLLPRPALSQAEPALDPEAKIHVVVAGVPDLTSDYALDSAGNIQMLFVNQVHLGGLTLAQAATVLASKQELGQYYKNPQIVVSLISPGGISVGLTGSVAAQGTRPLRRDAHLNDLLQQAGPALEAQLDKVQITHGGPGEAHTQDTVNYLAFLNSQDPAGNPTLRDNDVIYVPRKEAQAVQVNVRGQVAKPGQAVMMAKTTVYDALQAAGGLLVDGDRHGITVQHADGTPAVPFDIDVAQRQIADTQVNPVLRDGDTITVQGALVPNIYTITGAVRSPATYPLTASNVSLADAIARAGGLGDRPKLKELLIVRKVGGKGVQSITMDATDPTVQGNTLIQPGDNISIPQGKARGHADPLGVLGGVLSVVRIFGL